MSDFLFEKNRLTDGAHSLIKYVSQAVKIKLSANEVNIFRVNKNGSVVKVDAIPGITILEANKGGGSIIVFHEGTLFTNCRISVREKSCVIFEPSEYKINNLMISNHNGWGSLCYFGRNFSCNGAELRLWEFRDIYIGNDVMFSWHVMLFTSDGHSVINSSGDLTNVPEDIVISDHVWVGQGVKILKGSFINKNNVIAMNSLISKQHNEQNVLIAGTPGKVIKSEIRWERKRLFKVEREHPKWMKYWS